MQSPPLYSGVLKTVVLLLCFAALNGLPHPNCAYTASSLDCTQANLDIPGNFDVSLVPNVRHLQLSCPNVHYQTFCNTLREDCEPLPWRSALVRVTLQGFQATTGHDHPPFGRFLQNIAHQITELSIYYSQINVVDAELLRRFAALTVLSLTNNRIQAIAPDAFQALSYPRAPDFNLTVAPTLRQLNLNSNALRHIDLTVFRPVAQSLDTLDLSSQSPWLNSLTHSDPSVQFLLTTFTVRSNSLTNLSREVLQAIAPRKPSSFSFDLESNSFCSSTSKTDCSCCEMENVLRWASSIRKPLTNTGILFSCAGRSYTDRSAFTLDLFRNCPSQTATLQNAVCYEAPPIVINCTGNGEMATSEPDLPKSDASAVAFSAINGFRCRSTLYDIHVKLLQMADISHSNQSLPGIVTAVCSQGTLTADVSDANTASVTKLTLDSDSSAECREKLHQFVTFIYTKKFPRNPNQNLNTSLAIIPVDRWTKEFLICTTVPPLVVRCNGTTTIFSYNHTDPTNATALLFESDDSFRCRQIAINIHKHILSQRNTVVESAVSETTERDAVVAVCQKGQVVLSDGNPEQSVYANIRYYSAPNQLCRDAFARFRKYLQSALG
ncbi:uncharacterized protein LOC129588884 [Paramacrobiotus metropolitanus]|uniref:uncharacterized protein LOC129588884 n=1 Tax=Paramacrobiotus metropolitanus TaxID=2943436 RepID=UPI00244606C0|nr:uncharacterized protein LOC129588884 [Paramacrobiotus metropolitanus]